MTREKHGHQEPKKGRDEGSQDERRHEGDRKHHKK